MNNKQLQRIHLILQEKRQRSR